MRNIRRKKRSPTKQETADYCSLHCITPSETFRSFYFVYKGQRYRISDHEPLVSQEDGLFASIVIQNPMENLIDIHQFITNDLRILNRAS